jgi:tetratricopeptide (TPR) repeat protein
MLKPKPLSLLHLLLMLPAAGLYPVAAFAQNNVIFMGTGYARMCSDAAHAPDEAKKFELTGSRVSLTSMEVCTLAIDLPEMGPIDRAGSYNNRGVLHFTQNNFALALADFEAAIRLNDKLALAHANRGYALAAQQRWAESIESFDRGLALGTTEAARAHFNRAIAYEELGDLRAAYQDYLRASELAPDWEDPKLELTRFSVR